MKKTLTYYSIFFMAFLILQRLAGFLTKIVMANSITPYEYGIITLVAITLPAMLQLVTNLNFYQLLSHSEEGEKHFGFSLFVSLALVLLCSVLLVFFNEPIFSYLNLPLNLAGLFLQVIIISMFCVSITIDFQGYFAGVKLYSIPGFLMTLPTLARFIVICLLMWLGVTSFTIYLLVFALSNAIPLIFIALSSQTRAAFDSIKTIHAPSKKLFAFGTSIFIAGNFSMIGQYLIRLVLSHELGIDWQGFYDVSQTLSMVMVFALGTMTYITVPEATKSDKNSLYDTGGLGEVTRGLFALILFLAILLSLYANYLVVLIFSADYLPAAEYVFIIAIGYIFFFIQNFLSHVNLSCARRGRDYIVLTLIPLCLLPFFFYFTGYIIQVFKEMGFGNGFIGAYISYTTLIIVLTFLTIYSCHDLTPLKFLFRKGDRLILSAVLPSILIYYLNPAPVAGILCLAVTFTAMVFLTGYLKPSMFLDLFRN